MHTYKRNLWGDTGKMECPLTNVNTVAINYSAHESIHTEIGKRGSKKLIPFSFH